MKNEYTLILHTREKTRAIGFDGAPLLIDVLQGHGVSFAHPCGGRGVCLKCAVDARGSVSPPNELERRAGVRLSCQMRLEGDCEVTLSALSAAETQTDACLSAGALDLAADIGTTTLEMKLFDSVTGELVRRAAAPNPQAGFSADVIGRITAALSGKAEAMRTQLQSTLLGMIGEGTIKRVVMTGNTVMLTLLTGRSPRALASAPFTPDCLFGHTEQVFGIPAYLPRCTGAFTGADLTCAIFSSGMTEREDTSLLCDIGTNGEIALWHQGELYVTSAAVGPAFEGAGISRGMGGVPGAIDKVWTALNAIDAHVIGGGEPAGICGSGLIDAVAVLLRLKRIDCYGTMDGDTVRIAGDIALTRRDIRQVQLAKAAVAAGIETLMDTAGVTAGDIGTLFIAGGFGSHLDPRSAAAIGLFPLALAPKARVLGNAALEGACMLLDEKRREKADRIAGSARVVALSGNPQFEAKYLRHMNFT